MVADVELVEALREEEEGPERLKDLICSGTCNCAGMTPPWW